MKKLQKQYCNESIEFYGYISFKGLLHYPTCRTRHVGRGPKLGTRTHNLQCLCPDLLSWARHVGQCNNHL